MENKCGIGSHRLNGLKWKDIKKDMTRNFKQANFDICSMHSEANRINSLGYQIYYLKTWLLKSFVIPTSKNVFQFKKKKTKTLLS